MLSYLNSTILAQFISFIGLGMIVDAILPRRHKDIISGFVFSLRRIDRSNFEVAIISGFIEALSRPDKIERLSFRRIFVFSASLNFLSYFLGSALLMHVKALPSMSAPPFIVTSRGLETPDEIAFRDQGPLTYYWPSWSFEDPQLLATLFAWSVGFTLVLSPIFFLLDLVSIKISKKIWYYTPHPTWKIPLLACVDTTLSILAPIALIVLSGGMLSIAANSEGRVVLMAILVGSFFSYLALNLFQLSIIASGHALRSLSSFSRRYYPDRLDTVSAYPVTACFAVTGVFLVVLELMAT